MTIWMMRALPKMTQSWLVNVILSLTLRTQPNVCLTKGNHFKFYSHTWDTLLSLSSHSINSDFFPLWPSFTKAFYQRHLLLCSKSAPPHLRPFFASQLWIKAMFFQARSLALQQLFPWDDVSCFDSSGSSEVKGAASQDLSEPGPRRYRTVPSAAPECFPLPDVNSCLWEGGRDDGKMFFPTCAMLSSCCDTEIEKHPYFHFLTFAFFPTFTSLPLF